MPLRRAALAASLLLIAVLVATGLTTPTLAAPASDRALLSQAAEQRAPLRYVALGDSYSAASGVLPLDPGAALQCLRSTRNYPHVIAREIGARLTDVTCGGADTGDFFTAQYPNVPRQLDALDRRTQLVTMTIGGNDSGVFINAILRCGAEGTASLGRGNPCQRRYGDSFVRTIRRTTYPSLVRALRGVERAAPNARVAIIGYPWILPRTGGCFPQMPVARGDVPYLRELQRVLNDAVRRAAKATKVTYVNLNRVSEGHDACQRIGVRWVEPVVAGTNPVIVHPNALGERRMAQQVIQRLRLR